ncbi:MAG: S41 family peptidase [Muribaculaceae bacterium]|nr:S41 family peptidase [Muribaculaceae bacterium]
MKKFAFSVLFAAAALVVALSVSAKSTKTDISRNLSIFSQVYKELQTSYVDTIDATKTMRTAIDALLGQIDPYTEYYSADEQDQLTSVSSGQYAGIGSYIMKRDSAIVLSEPQWNSPARKAGVRHGDVLLSINGKTLPKTFTTAEASAQLKGQAGTDVTITVRRPWMPQGADSILTFTITRGTINIDPVPYSGVVAPNIGYINISTFSEKTAGDFLSALNRLRAENPQLKGLVIDLRDNGGGLLQSAVEIASYFLPRGTEIVTTRGRDARTTKTYKTTHNPVAPDLPLAVIVNGNTASASEILSGSLQDLDRAVIIGQRSYGKGLVQNPRPLPYNAMMKVTTGRYYLPTGRLIQAIDYTHRNAEGEATRIPDSLTTVFHTRAGREVRDGGGITPDIAVELPESNRLLYTIMSELWAYDFANKYANNLAQAPSPDTWQVDDSVFNQFKRFIDPARFKYDRATEAGIKYLRDAARIEGYMSDSVDSAITHLENMMKHNLERDLDFNRKAISTILNSEMGNRWFSNADLIRRTLPDDKELKEAVNVLNDPRQYGVILSPKPKDEKTAKPAKPKK